MMKPQIAFLIAAMVGTTTPAMAATIYVPMGDADRILVIDGDQDRIIGKVEGVTAAHGLAGTADGKYLVAGSFAEAEPDKASVPAKPKGVSEEDHAAHHAKRSTPAEASNNAVSPVSIS